MDTRNQMQSFNKITPQDLVSAKVLFGHLSKKWNPKMKKFILMKKNNLHILDPNKTLRCLASACTYAKSLALLGKKILFVGTKQQAKSIVSLEASKVNMPHVTERWLGGTLTNFIALRKLIKKWQSFERLMASPTYKNLTKKEQLTITREKDKLGTLLGGLADVSRLPAAIFVVDINRESIAVKEAIKLGIPVIAIVDTNSDPDLVDVPIPANDDSVKSIELVVCAISSSISEGIKERLIAKSNETISKVADVDASELGKQLGEVGKSEAPKAKHFSSQVRKSETSYYTTPNSATKARTVPKQKEAGSGIPRENDNNKPKTVIEGAVANTQLKTAVAKTTPNDAKSKAFVNKPKAVSIKKIDK